MLISDVFLAIWRRKWHLFGFAASLSLIFGLFLYFSPRAYRAEIQYAFRMNAPTLQKLLDRFYSSENRQRLFEKFQEHQLESASAQILQAEGPADLVHFLTLRATPNYIDYAQKQNMKLSFERTWADNIEKLEKLTAEFLVLNVQGIPAEEMEQGLPLIRHNLEEQLPLYKVQDHWVDNRLHNSNLLAEFDATRQSLALELQRLEQTLAQLKAIPPKPAHDDSYQLQIQVDSKNPRSHLLPLPLQIQSYEAEIVEKKEHIADRNRRHQLRSQYNALLVTMLAMVDRQLKNQGDLAGLLADMAQARDQQTQDLAKEFLTSHIRMVESARLNQRPLTEKASISPIAKGTVTKTLFVFVVLLLVGILAVGLEDFAKRQQPST